MGEGRGRVHATVYHPTVLLGLEQVAATATPITRGPAAGAQQQGASHPLSVSTPHLGAIQHSCMSHGC